MSAAMDGSEFVCAVPPVQAVVWLCYSLHQYCEDEIAIHLKDHLLGTHFSALPLINHSVNPPPLPWTDPHHFEERRRQHSRSFRVPGCYLEARFQTACL